MGIGFSDGLGIGVLAFIQVWFILGGLFESAPKLEKRYSKAKVFFILSGISTLGLALGAGLGLWLL